MDILTEEDDKMTIDVLTFTKPAPRTLQDIWDASRVVAVVVNNRSGVLAPLKEWGDNEKEIWFAFREQKINGTNIAIRYPKEEIETIVVPTLNRDNGKMAIINRGDIKNG